MKSLNLPVIWQSWILSLALIVMAVEQADCAASRNPISLAGEWRFRIDREDVGIAETWFERKLPDKVRLPGSLSAQGIGEDVTVNTKWTGGIVDKSFFTAPEYERYRQPGKVQVPFWLQPEKYYAGAAWYQRDIEIPDEWVGKRIVLFLERTHWETRVWVDSRLVGTVTSLATPHEYELGQLTPGKHTVSIRVDNRMVIDIGENSHCISDHTQGNWNGIVGRIELRATPLVWIEDVQLFPKLSSKSARARITIRNSTRKSAGGELVLLPGIVDRTIGLGARRVVWECAEESAAVEVEVPLDRVTLTWDEFTPNRYSLLARSISQQGGHVTIEQDHHVEYGLRQIATDGTQFTINGRKTFLRGTLDCCIFPKTGHPPMEIEEWRRIIRVAKSFGLNLIRFHSWCPPEAAFQAADELGFYFQIETCWPNQSTSLGDGKPVDQWIYDETDRILKYYGNHPSFLLMAAGNEPGGRNANAYLAKYVAHYKAHDPRRLWTSGAGWPQLPENQFHVTPDPRIQSWGGGLRSRINARPPETTADYRDYIARRNVPVISHEIGQWCVYPNFDEIPKYTGYLKPRNFEIFRDRLNEHGMGDLAKQFFLASGKLQTLCYKEEIESALRTPGMGGFELLDLHDFPGQGTALVGVLDPFWEEKGYVTAEEFRRFCNSTVPLARLKKRVFTTDDKLEADIEVAHFGDKPIENASVRWALVAEDGKWVSHGELPSTKIPYGNGIKLDTLSASLRAAAAPARYRLLVMVNQPASSGEVVRSTAGNIRTPTQLLFQNDWDLWVYPPSVNTSVPAGITVVNELNKAGLDALKSGDKVLLLIPPDRVAPDKKRGKVALGFSSIFWNTAWTQQQPPHTLGILCDPKHPLFSAFPTEFHSNWQWWYLISRAGAMILDDASPALRPTVQVIDDWFTARKLGLVVEARLGAGSILICSVDLQTDLADDPVRRQFRHSLLQYMASEQFKPSQDLTVEQVHALMVPPSTLSRVGLRSFQADSEEVGFEAGQAIDGNPHTFWHTAFRDGQPGFPHEFVLRFDHPIEVAGFSVLPRQDNNRNGLIRDYELYASMDGRNWGSQATRGTFSADANLERVQLAKPITARYLRLVVLSSHNGQPFAAIAEFDVQEAKP